MPAARTRTLLAGAAPNGPGGAHNGLTVESVAGIQRARMIGAMAQATREHGAANVTVAQVVAHSGVSRRTFYEQFTDREDCFLATVEQAIAHASEYVQSAYDKEASWRERIRAALIGLLTFFETEPDMGRLLVVETLSAGNRALERRQQVLAHVVAAVDEGRTASKTAKQLPQVTAESVVGGALAVLHTRLQSPQPGLLLALTGQLMSMIVLPYLGAQAARRELERPTPKHDRPQPLGSPAPNPLHQLGMRLTYRTMRVLGTVAEHPASSNRQVAAASGVSDQGQMSKLLARLEKLGLIQNTSVGSAGRGEPNAWTLTGEGWRVHGALAQQHAA